MQELVNKVAPVSTPDQANAFADDFLTRWQENAQFCPGVVKSALEFSTDPPLFLTNAFLRPAFTSPRSFGLIPLSLQITPDSTTLILEALSARAVQLWELIHSVESPPPLPSAEKLSKILPDLGKSALFTADDMEILNGLVESANRVCADFPVKPPADPPAVARGQEYQTFSFTSPSIQDIQRSASTDAPGSPEDEIERQLREMLTGVDVIPLAAQSSGQPDMVELLKSQVQLARPDHRLLLEMKIDDFETARKKLPGAFKFTDFLRVLRDRFDARQPQRLERLAKISLYNTEFSQMGQLSKVLKKNIDVYRDVLKFHLVEKWLNERLPLADISDELHRDSRKFCEFFAGVVAKWKQWCAEHGYAQTPTLDILHNIVMLKLPQEDFLRVNPQFAEWDRACCQGIKEKKEELLRQNTFDFTATFQESPKLLEPAQRQLHRCPW
jgi:hypothetical protein